LVVINKESGIDEVKIVLERKFPRLYERTFCPIHSLLYDRLHDSTEMRMIHEIMNKHPFPIFGK